MSAHSHHERHNHDTGHEYSLLEKLRGHSHEYSLETKEDRQRLMVCILANGAYGMTQLLVGFLLLRSMILVTDASHNISDMVSLGIPLAVILLRSRYTVAPLALTCFNYMLLLSFLAWAALESWHRVLASDSTDTLVASVTLPVIGGVNSGVIMASTAGIGISVNAFSVIILSKGKMHDLNMKSAFEHQLVDLIASIVAVFGSIGIAITGETTIDPLLTIAASAALAWMVWPSFTQAWRDLLRGRPAAKSEDHSH